MRDCFFTLFDLIFVRSLFGALNIIRLNLFQLVFIERNLRRAPFIDEVDRNSVFDRLRHRIFGNDRPEYVDRGVDGRTRKADIGGIRERIVQIFCKAELLFHTVFRNAHLLLQIDLRTVRLVRNTDDIRSVRQQLRVLRKFLNGSQIYAAACPALQFFPQVCARFNTFHRFVADKLFRITKSCRKLRIKVCPIRNKDDRRALKKLAPHEHTR